MIQSSRESALYMPPAATVALPHSWPKYECPLLANNQNCRRTGRGLFFLNVLHTDTTSSELGYSIPPTTVLFQLRKKMKTSSWLRKKNWLSEINVGMCTEHILFFFVRQSRWMKRGTKKESDPHWLLLFSATPSHPPPHTFIH